MKDQLCKAFCDNVQVRSVPAGLAVSTNFLSPEGDRIGFYVRHRDDGLFRIEDDGFTLPALEASGLDFSGGSRGEAMAELLSEYGVAIDDDARAFTVEGVLEADLATVAMRFVAFSLRVRDFALMTEARVFGTFREDVAKLLRESIGDRATIEERAFIAPELRDFAADFVLRAAGREPVGVFLGTSGERVMEAVFIRMKALHETHTKCGVIALLERDNSVTKVVRRTATNRLTSIAEFRGDEITAIQNIAIEALGHQPLSTEALRPDGWERFERAVDIGLKTPAVHRKTEEPVGASRAGAGSAKARGVAQKGTSSSRTRGRR